MIPTVGIRQLKQQASQLVRQVRETGDPVQITHHGKVVAWLIPAGPAEDQLEQAAAWAALDELAVQIGKQWPDDISASHAISEGRRE